MWLFCMLEQYEGILFKRDEQETLLVKQEVICRLIREKIIEFGEKKSSPLPPSQCTDGNIMEKLADSHTIYGYKRSDGFRKILHFPVFSINNDYADNNSPYGYIHISDEYSMVKINTDEIECSHLYTSTICDVKEFNEMAKKFDDSHRRYGRSILKKEVNDLRDALGKIDRHIDLK